MRQTSHSSRLVTRTILGEEYKSLSSSLYNFIYSLLTFSLLGPNILLNTLFSNTLNLRYSLNVSYQISHPLKTTVKIVVLYIVIFKFCITNWKTKDSARMIASIPTLQPALNIFLNRILIC